MCILLSVGCSVQFVKLASEGHNVEMQRITKQALNNFGNDFTLFNSHYIHTIYSDDKVRILSCGVCTKIYLQELEDERSD